RSGRKSCSVLADHAFPCKTHKCCSELQPISGDPIFPPAAGVCSMISFSRALPMSWAGLVSAAIVLGLPASGWAQGRVELAPHRAVYDLKLSQSRGNRPVESVRGRILYDFQGNSCEGYALQFRQVSEIDLGEGKSLTTDLRATTWEEGEAKSF